MASGKNRGNQGTATASDIIGETGGELGVTFAGFQGYWVLRVTVNG
jgi:hypothetical protein